MGKQKNTFIVAELSANHNQSIELAKNTIKAAKESGADAIKLQTYTADTITLNCDKDPFVLKDTIWKGMRLYDLYKQAYTPWEWHDELFNFARDSGLVCFSTAFDKQAVDFLEKLDNPIYKIASFEIVDIPLIKYAAKKGKPMVISTGIATLSDIELAVDKCREVGNNDITLLKCTSSYPAPIEEANLRTMVNMKETFNTRIGLSDHTIGIDVAIAAVALGAEVIEKHFILDRSINSPDSAFSAEPNEFKQMVESIRNVEKCLGKIDYSLDEKRMRNRKQMKSIFVSKNVSRGDILCDDNIKIVRPGYGLHPKYYEKILGKKFNDDYEMGNPIRWEMIC